MKPCDLILVKGKGFISSAIEEITNSKYSHVAGSIGCNKLVEAEGFEKTGKVPLSKYNGNYDLYTCDSLTDKQRDMILEYVNEQIGGHYNYFLLIIEFIRYVFHIVLPYKEPFKSHICSMLWYDAYKSVGIDLCPSVKYPSPKDISESKLLRKIDN